MKNLLKSPLTPFVAAVLGGLAMLVAGWIGWGVVSVLILVVTWGLTRPRAVPSPVPADKAQVLEGDLLDEMTNLPNQTGLSTWFRDTADKESRGILLLVAAVDSYAELEKKRGAEVAQAVVKDMAQRLVSTVGSEGLAARPGDGEFVAVKRYESEKLSEAAEVDAGKLAELLQRPVELPTGVVWVGGSVGAAFGSVRDAAGVLARARKAADQAIRLGRGHFHVDASA